MPLCLTQTNIWKGLQREPMVTRPGEPNCSSSPTHSSLYHIGAKPLALPPIASKITAPSSLPPRPAATETEQPRTQDDAEAPPPVRTQDAQPNKLARHSTDAAVASARERYLARRRAVRPDVDVD